MPGSLTSNEIEDVVSSVRRLVSTDHRHRPATPDKLILTPSLRVVQEDKPVSPLVLTGADRADLEPSAAEAEWVEEPLWAAPEAPLAEIALGAEEAELIEDQVPEAPMWPEAEEGWVEDAGSSESTPVVPFPRSAMPSDPPPVTQPNTVDEDDDDIDVAGVLTAAMLEDESIRVMDEAELQVLVREMVRLELQGTLGERITRNVRKLVRSEVNRALAARALD